VNVCIPIVKDHGLDSRISPHFSAAPRFLVVDPQSRSFRVLSNDRAGQRGGGREVVSALLAEHIDALVVGGIGAGAVGHLARAGVRLYGASSRSVTEVLEELRRGTLPPLAADGPLVHGHGDVDGGGPLGRHRHGRGAG